MLMGKLLALPQQQLPGESDRFQEGRIDVRRARDD